MKKILLFFVFSSICFSNEFCGELIKIDKMLYQISYTKYRFKITSEYKYKILGFDRSKVNSVIVDLVPTSEKVIDELMGYDHLDKICLKGTFIIPEKSITSQINETYKFYAANVRCDK